MTIKIPPRLTSRKFWIAVVAFSLGAYGYFSGRDVAAELQAILLAAGPVYIIIEGWIDHESAKLPPVQIPALKRSSVDEMRRIIDALEERELAK